MNNKVQFSPPCYSSFREGCKRHSIAPEEIVAFQHQYTEYGLQQIFQWNRYQKLVRKARARWILPFLRRTHRILDVGCFDGFILNQLRNHIREGIGIDIGETAIQRAAKRFGGGNLSFCVSTLEDFEDAKGFDGILFFEVIEHLPSAENALKKIYTLLKPGGVLAVSTPNADRLENRMRRFFRRKPSIMPMHVKEFSCTELEDLLTSNGLTIRKRGGAQFSSWMPGYSRIPERLRKIARENRPSWFLGKLFPSLATVQLTIAMKAP